MATDKNMYTSDLFELVHRDNTYFIDKTDLIKTLVPGNGAVKLFIRPRGFGKTFILSMFETFFNLERKEESPHFFEGFKILEDTEFCKEHQSAYPVIFLEFYLARDDYENTLHTMARELLAFYDCIRSLPNRAELPKNESELLEKIAKKGCYDIEEEVLELPRIAMKLLYQHYGKKVIVLLDDYDSPLRESYLRGYEEKMFPAYRKMVDSIFRDNPYLELGIIAGSFCLEKEEVFAGMDNLDLDTLLNPKSPPYFGFTRAETEKVLADCDLTDQAKTVYEWYRGGNGDLYNTYSVINFAREGMRNLKYAKQEYLMGMVGNYILRKILKTNDYNPEMRAELQKVIDGTPVTKKISENLTFTEFKNDPDSMWPILFFSGYLKTISDAIPINGENHYELAVPNEEARLYLKKQIGRWFNRNTVY